MQNLQRLVLLWVVLLAVTVVVPGRSVANELVSGTFSTSGQSQWGPGPSFTFDYSKSAGISWAHDITLGHVDCIIDDICNGAQASLETAGNIGVDLGFHVDSGTVNATQNASFNVMFPSLPVPSRAAPVESTLNGFGIGTLNTKAPNVQAFSDLFLGFDADANGKACTFFTGCLRGGLTLASVHATEELASFNRGGNGKLRLLGQDTGFGFGQPVSSGGITATVNNLPNTSGSGAGGHVPSSGHSDVLSASANVTNIAARFLGIPLSGSISIDSIARLRYNLLTAILNLDNLVDQNFMMTSDPTSLMVDYHVQQTGADFIAPLDTPVDIPFDGFTDLDITPTFFGYNASLGNSTSLCVQPSESVTALSGSVNLFGFFNSSFGPLFSQSKSFGCVGGEISLFNSTFGLDGWNAIQGQQFEVVQTPEPDSLLLLGIALTVLAGLIRRRRASEARG
jgi:hypothetical protein